MKSRYYFFLQFALLVLVFVVFQIANSCFDILPTNLWYSPVHFLAGFWLALFFRWIFAECALPFNLFFCLALVFMVGSLWEGWEYAIGAIDFPETHMIDTIGDLVLDIFGAFFGFLFLKSKKIGDILQSR